MNAYSKKYFNKETQKWELLYSTEGRSAYETAKLNGYTGTEAEFNKALVLAVNPDSEPTEGSENYVTSGAVWKVINDLSNNVGESLETLKNEVNQADKVLDDKIVSTNSAVNDLTVKHNSEISSLQSKDTQLETKITEMKTAHDSDIHNLELADNNLSAEISNLKNKDILTDGEITNLKAEDTKIKSSISDLESLIQSLPHLSIEKVHSVTEVNNPKSDVLYLSETRYVLGTNTSEQQDPADTLYEYLYVDSKWELVGTTAIDLSDYYTKEEVNNKLTNPDLGNVITSSKFKGANYILVSNGADNSIKDSSILISDLVTKSDMSSYTVSWDNVTNKPTSFIPSAHNQSSDTINSLSGYTISATSGALSSTDTLNVALGKLEKGLSEKEPSFSKNTAFNKNFGTGNDDVARGNHLHGSTYARINHMHDYATDLINKPTIPSKTSDLVNDSGFITSVSAQSWDSITGKPNFATVATSGSYNDLTDKPTIPSAYTLSVASSSSLGGIKIGYTQNGQNYPILLSNEMAYVNVPWNLALPTTTSFGYYGIYATESTTEPWLTSTSLTAEKQISINIVPYNVTPKFIGSRWKIISNTPDSLTSGYKVYCLQYVSDSIILVNVGHYITSTDTE